MCGFLTWVTNDSAGNAPPVEALDNGLSRIAHRGPDDKHVHSGREHWFGFRRLSILDLSENGRQPMVFKNGRYVLVYNGEIYNYRDLIPRLEGEQLFSSGDSEVVGHLLAKFGVEETLSMLRGMFAFAWWDREKRELFAARDHFGIKPLYFARTVAGGLALCSELKGLLGLPGVDPTINRDALAQYFTWGAVQGPSVIVDAVECLRPGYFLHWRDSVLQTKLYFMPRWSGKAHDFDTHGGCVRAAREGLLESIRTHLISDVPVGVFLSGGLDSTIIAAGMKEVGIGDLRSFSIGYEGDAGVEDESLAASRTAEFLGATHVTETVSAQRLEELFDSYIWSLDQPSGDALNTFLVSRLAAQHVKVSLSGLGADEWFGGYNHHRLAVLARQFGVRPAFLRACTGPLVSTLLGLLLEPVRNRPHFKAIAYLSGARGWEAQEFYESARTIVPAETLQRLMGPVDPGAYALRGGDSNEHWLDALFDCETRGYLQNTLLRDNDCVSMAHSLELRVPFVDRVVHDWGARVPPGEKVTIGGGKLILREAMADLLPAWILDDHKKKTFTLPLMKWLRTPKWNERVRDILGSTACRERGWFDVDEARRLLAVYDASDAEGRQGWVVSQRVWLCFVLESWAQSHLDNMS